MRRKRCKISEDIWTDRQTDRQTDKVTDRQTDRHVHTDRNLADRVMDRKTDRHNDGRRANRTERSSMPYNEKNNPTLKSDPL